MDFYDAGLDEPPSPAPVAWVPGCQRVLNDVLARRHQQVTQYGMNEDLANGTGPDVKWLYPVELNALYMTEPGATATDIEELLRQEYAEHERDTGNPTWMHLVREEVAEAFKENDPAKLEDELLDVAALCVSWVEKLRCRGLRSSTPVG